jgi:hypothetical protein
VNKSNAFVQFKKYAHFTTSIPFQENDIVNEWSYIQALSIVIVQALQSTVTHLQIELVNQVSW